MAIVAVCDCGKRTSVADVMAGRSIRCAACGDEVFVASSPAQSPKSSKGSKTKTASAVTGKGVRGAGKSVEPSRIVISPTLITAGIIGFALLAIWAALYFGPWRVGSEWAAISNRANDEVTDVVLFAIQAYESEHGGYNPAHPIRPPQITGPANFVPPMMAFTMPRNIIFVGKTNQGNYSGTYSPSTGEIVATIETGGYSVAGLVDIKKAESNFKITGREHDGHPQAEVDGKPLVIVYPKAFEEK